LLCGQQAFFEADLFPGEETPDRRHAHMHAASGQLSPELLKRQIVLRPQARQKPIALARQFGAIVAAHLSRLQPAGRAQLAAPLDPRALAHVQMTRSRPRRHAFVNQTAEPLPQIR